MCSFPHEKMSKPSPVCSFVFHAKKFCASYSVRLPERFGFRLAPSAPNSMSSPEIPSASSPNVLNAINGILIHLACIIAPIPRKSSKRGRVRTIFPAGRRDFFANGGFCVRVAGKKATSGGTEGMGEGGLKGDGVICRNKTRAERKNRLRWNGSKESFGSWRSERPTTA